MRSYDYRAIVKNWDPEYMAIWNREKRYWTLQYFNQYNKWEIIPRHLKEKKLFNATDLYYLKEMNKKANNYLLYSNK